MISDRNLYPFQYFKLIITPYVVDLSIPQVDHRMFIERTVVEISFDRSTKSSSRFTQMYTEKGHTFDPTDNFLEISNRETNLKEERIYFFS